MQIYDSADSFFKNTSVAKAYGFIDDESTRRKVQKLIKTAKELGKENIQTLSIACDKYFIVHKEKVVSLSSITTNYSSSKLQTLYLLINSTCHCCGRCLKF